MSANPHDENRVIMEGFNARSVYGKSKDQNPYRHAGDWREAAWDDGWTRADQGGRADLN